MEWRDEGIVIGLKRHGETSAIVETLTKAHGRTLGLVRGGRSSKLSAALQPGNTLSLVWRARLDEHLGVLAVEPLSLRAGRILGSGLAVMGMAYLGALLRLIPERDPHLELYEALAVILEHLDDPIIAPALLAKFELRFLADCGFALDLEKCAVTAARTDLAYVSPKTGRAVSASAGEDWKEKLLPLPPFLLPVPGRSPSPENLRSAFKLTGYFLERDIFGPRNMGIPDARRSFLTVAGLASSDGIVSG